MKQTILITALLISALSCSQKKTEQPKTKTQPMTNIDQYIAHEAKNITAANYVEKLNAQIKHYPEEPIYYFRINKQNCLVEVYINDIKNYTDFKLGNYITPTEVGHILKSGPQTITVKMYPVGNLLNESWGKTDAKPMAELTENSEVSIEIVRIDEKSKKGLNDEISIIKKISPKEVTGKETFEFSFTFDAKVPYEYEGWTKGQDISKLDQELVRKKAVEFYEMIGKLYVNKELDNVLKLDYPADIRIKGTYYVNKLNLQETLEEYTDDVKGYNYKMEPIQNYKMEYMGNKKLLRLVTNSLDIDLRGGGALWLSYDDDGFFAPGITLYLPEGRDLATQGFMMWK
ncbi:hypothetical protein [Empedobacter sedimenti]|uniref:hypothetical protein n=1 Tax=Empedobacter sedimenti TaxID=3042610 RepID=UPI0024A77ECD|nr:hypothetical protein [Empedobacter sedimenti]